MSPHSSIIADAATILATRRRTAITGPRLPAEQIVITDSYAGGLILPVGPATTIRYGELGTLSVRFTPQ